MNVIPFLREFLRISIFLKPISSRYTKLSWPIERHRLTKGRTSLVKQKQAQLKQNGRTLNVKYLITPLNDRTFGEWNKYPRGGNQI